MPNPKLTGVYAKIDRAKHHLSQLHATLEAWGSAEENDHAPTFDYYPERDRLEFVLHKVRPDDINWSLIVGDVVHNLRCALDHLVFQLALLNGNPVEECHKAAFPICIDEASYKQSSRRIKGLVSPNVLAEIEALQPYKAAAMVGKDPRKSNLWIISQLDIIDKHRTLVIAAKYFRASSISYTVNDGEPTIIEAVDTWKPLVDGAKIATIDFSGAGIQHEDKVRVKAQTEVQIFFNETGCGCDGLTVEDALRPCMRFIWEVVELFGRQFFSLGE